MRAEGVMQTYQTGDSLIFKVPEREISLQPAALYPEAFPVAEAEAVIQPIALSIHSWVVQTPYDLIVIDTATGNGRERGGNPLYHQLNTPYLENLRAARVNPEDVTPGATDSPAYRPCRMEYRLAGRSLGAAVSQRPLSVLGKRAVAGEKQRTLPGAVA